MTDPVRKTVSYSSDGATLARQVAELARDVEGRTRAEQSVHTWQGIVTYGKRFRVDVGAGKPDAVVCTAVEDVAGRSFVLPGPFIWSWVDGQMQVDDSIIGFTAGVVYLVTFLVIRLGV